MIFLLYWGSMGTLGRLQFLNVLIEVILRLNLIEIFVWPFWLNILQILLKISMIFGGLNSFQNLINLWNCFKSCFGSIYSQVNWILFGVKSELSLPTSQQLLKYCILIFLVSNFHAKYSLYSLGWCFICNILFCRLFVKLFSAVYFGLTLFSPDIFFAVYSRILWTSLSEFGLYILGF